MIRKNKNVRDMVMVIAFRLNSAVIAANDLLTIGPLLQLQTYGNEHMTEDSEKIKK